MFEWYNRVKNIIGSFTSAVQAHLRGWWEKRNTASQILITFAGIISFIASVLGIWQWWDATFDQRPYATSDQRPYLGIELKNHIESASVEFEEAPEATNEYTSLPKSDQDQQLKDGTTREQTVARLPNVNVEPNYYSIEGVEVTSVTSDGPADKAGIEVGDIIVRLGNTPVRNIVDFERTLVEKYDPGDKARLTLVWPRSDSLSLELKDVTLTLEESN